MFCLRSWLPLLFIPTNASPLFIISFVTLTYVLHRPCIYCSALLLILFISSCHWSDRCFFDLRGDWFSPRFTTSTTAAIPDGAGSLHPSSAFYSPANASMLAPSETLAEYVWETVNTTTKTLAAAVVDEAQRRLALNGSSVDAAAGLSDLHQDEWTGIGLEWLRSLLGRREWTLPCVDVKVRL
ncbi:hypothetical protein N8T08_004300 [Aspergillus melleus]|uniref:Uncharacterized protein n=1 Tax=Aspergillus melleus TaxID=138277 RepID=A0ACC3B5E7_9EURO|nr:hypothetical protein N8T08_004300 [Aspergillus melleus]